MKSQSIHNTYFLALVLSLCCFFSGYVIFKNFSQPAAYSITINDEKDAEQKEEVKELADVWLLSPMTRPDHLFRPATLKPVVFDEYIDYYHYVAPEIPPPNG